MKLIAEFPQAFFEYRAVFRKPPLSAWIGKNDLLEPLYSSLREFGLELANAALNTAGSLEEANATFNLPKLGLSIQVFLAYAKFVALNPDWSRTDQIIAVFDAALRSIRTTTKVEVELQQVTLAMHVTAEGLKPKDVLSAVAEFRPSFRGDDVTGYGVSVYRADSSVTVDASTLFQGGLFIRVERRFLASAAFQDIAKSLYDDERRILDVLGFSFG